MDSTLPLGQAAALLGGAGLLAAVLVRLAAAGPGPSAVRRWAAEALGAPGSVEQLRAFLIACKVPRTAFGQWIEHTDAAQA
ncbi:hypothetical protein [Streptomyces lasiicapitis]|uniref:Uncharacterized protein n=1 Tax=Streptomyces lasiicapitis TaxID=1923961 RepID=A0ABQ2MVT7_9ACTN|nr:hypothetical protein [Streptomyces lasiicapitis]GGO58910.1 hypothetical protein GCM10012286_79300 [Streptomyces lasiicapitis]